MIGIARDADFKALFENAPGLYLVLDPGLHIVAVTDAYLSATVTQRDAILGRHIFDVFPDNPDDPVATGVGNLQRSLENVLATRAVDKMALQKYDSRVPGQDAFENRYWSCYNTPVLNAEGEVAFIIHRAEDVTEFLRLKQIEERSKLSGDDRVEAEVYESGQALQSANRRLEDANRELDALRRLSDERSAMLMATARDAKLVLDGAGVIVEANAEAERMLGRAASALVGKPVTEFFSDTRKADGLRVARPGLPDIFVDIAADPIPMGDGGQALFMVREVSDRVKLESQLRQSQKLEAVGQLTGGVAHDFNNLLLVITTTTEMLQERVAGQQSLLTLVNMIDNAAERGARLTHRMLAFARRQPLQPHAVDLNATVSGMGMMLSRTLGEHVTVSTHLAPEAWRVMADPSQIEDALLNLAINARDAMPNGGKLIVETANVTFSEDDAHAAGDLSAGDYVSLVISDTGTGMTQETAARAIEPFFTTKEVCQGTGLGLSMVFGFVKQSRGHLVIYSELGFGTSIKIFLPRAKDDATAVSGERNSNGVEYGRGETVLVVEDDVEVRGLAVTLLESLNYKVRAAQDGPSALHVLGTHPEIDLLFTDLMMPGGMSGIDLLREARRARPNLKALLTSGYPAQVIESRGAAPSEAPLLGKPYRKRELARAIRAALDT